MPVPVSGTFKVVLKESESVSMRVQWELGIARFQCS